MTDARINTTDLNEFKALVAEVALTSAKTHGWCAEINRILDRDLGLTDFIPPSYKVEYQDSENGPWYVYDSYGVGNSGFEQAKSVCLSQRASMTRSGRTANGGLPTSAQFSTTLYITTDDDALEAEISRLRNEHSRLKDAHATLLGLSQEKEYEPLKEFPKYRVVAIKGEASEEVYQATDAEIIQFGLAAGYTFSMKTLTNA